MTDAPTLDALARPSGTFAMVAMDQRESLRTMFRTAASGTAGDSGSPHRPPDDDVLVRFKLDVARALAPVASAFLIDRELGFERVRAEGLVPAGTGLILAADALQQEPGGPVEDTDLDEVVVAPDFDLAGVHALKLLLVWRRDSRREWRVGLAERFIAAARARGVLSVLEPVVRATPEEEAGGRWDGDAAAREAARELSPLGASLYKVQVPGAGRGTPDEQQAA